MDIDALASEFGSAGVSPPASTDADIHSLAAEFGSSKKAKEIEKSHGITIRPVAPPISGDTAPLPQPDVTQAGGANPRDSALSQGISDLPANVGNAIKQKALEGRALATEGVHDWEAGKPATGTLKIGGGILAGLTSPVTGTVQEAVEKPI